MGSALVLALYMTLLFSGIKIASQARDRLGKLLASGVVALFFSHVFENIGMNIRLMPVTGIPLPLLSYGGSSVVCSVIAIGIFSAMMLYDVQRVINGGETNYISATLAIYLDIYNVFVHLLSILGILGGSRD